MAPAMGPTILALSDLSDSFAVSGEKEKKSTDQTTINLFIQFTLTPLKATYVQLKIN